MVFSVLKRSYYVTISNFINEHIYMDHFGWEKCYPGHRVYCYRDKYLIHYIQKGSGTLNINNQDYHLHAGDVFLICPNQPAIYHSDDADPWEYYYFGFEGSYGESLVKKTVFHNSPVYHLNNDKFAEMIVDMKENLEKVSLNEFYSLEQLFKLLQLLSIPPSIQKETAGGSDSDKKTSSRYYTDQVLRYIHLNYKSNITVNSIAKEFNINRSLLYTYFKKETGTDIISYLTNIRMQHAREWLSHTNVSVSSIAGMVGYNNYTSFQRAFTQKEGITPGQYRKELQLKSVRHKNISVITDETVLEEKSGQNQS